ncbi:putative wd repeat-containing protein [Diaporthe ampelina]|uniref:Putative wd repeat-containing protein n=1 Tax=Diaporthe ampelina TaxID=1214573 RepID=A0A0G2FQB1_9PEZI|nr:putative wd repeat-containing protein [Diaporthe ampelina]
MNQHVLPRLQREHVHCPITALAFFRPLGASGPVYVLSGEDTHLKAYDAETQRLRASVRVFAAQPIQGISSPAGEDASSTDVLIWGGSLVTVLPGSTLVGLLHDGAGEGCRTAEHTVSNRQVLQAPDWVYHGAASPHQPGLAAVVTAHNEVIPLLRTGGPAGGWRLGRLRSPPSRPILYSAQVRWTPGGEVLVAAGTVFGEIIVWRCRVAGGGEGYLPDEVAVEVLHVFTGHEGSIFGVDFSPEVVIDPRTREVSRLLVSCSDDRTVRVWNVPDAGPGREKCTVDRAFTEARETGFGDNSSMTVLEAIANYHSAKALAVAVGHVSRIWSPREHETVLTASLTHEATFHNHDGKHIWSSALHFPAPSSPRKEFLATGGSDGKIQLIEESLARLGGNAVSSVPSVDASVVSNPATEDIVLHEASIELEKGFIPTAAGICQDLIVFGSRIGALSLHRLDQSGQGFSKVAHATRPGSKDSVSSIVSLPAKPGLPCPYFLTTSRDGRYRIYETATQACGGDDAVTIHLRHEAIPPLGPIIESGFFTTTTADPGSKPHLILCGFRSKDFIVWDETTQQELARVECGGGHRAFTYHVDPASPGRLSFIWTKASHTCAHAQDDVSKRSLKPGGHGREIKAAAAQGGYLATGAEDTNIRIWRVDGQGGAEEAAGLSCLAVVERHTAGIQYLRWAGGSYLVSSSGGEELFVWRVERLGRSTYESIAVFCEGVYPDKTRDGDLRIMSFDVQIVEPSRDDEDEGEEVLCLSLVLSNSTLKTYRYSKDEGFTLLAQGRYTGACMVQIRHLSIQPESDGPWDLHVLTASTDGHLAVWKATGISTTPAPLAPAEYELVEVQRLHQSSIKAIDLRTLPDAASSRTSYAVFTGGDDNAIGHVRLERAAGGDFRITARSLVDGAHAAAITGLCIAGVEADGAGGSCRVRLCTASNDQRVRSWMAVVGDGGAVGEVSLVGDGYSAVADCGDLEQLGDGKIVVAGVGMELWTV